MSLTPNQISFVLGKIKRELELIRRGRKTPLTFVFREDELRLNGSLELTSFTQDPNNSEDGGGGC